jgi:hypothetical protein
MVQITSPYYVKVMERGWERQWGKIQRWHYVLIVVVNTRNQNLCAMSLLNGHISEACTRTCERVCVNRRPSMNMPFNYIYSQFKLH